MKISTLIQLSPTLYRSGISVHLKSGPGIGKSNIVEYDIPRAIRKANNWTEEDFGVHMPPSVSSLEAPDVRGFTVPVEDPNGGRMRTASTVSPMIPASTAPKRGIVFLDEKQQAGADVAKPLAPFQLDGRVGEDQLQDGYVVWCASNRMSDRSGTTKEFMHVINREMHINLEFDIDSWCTWAFNAGIHPLFIAFAKFKSGIIAQDVPSTPQPFCTPRSYARFAVFCSQLAEDMGYDVGAALADRESGLGSLATECGMGMIGKAVATEALSFCRVADELPTWAQVLADPKGTAQDLPKSRTDVVFSAASMVVANATPETVPQAFEFTKGLRKEFQISTLASMLNRRDANDEFPLKTALATTPGFTEYVTANPALVMGSFG